VGAVPRCLARFWPHLAVGAALAALLAAVPPLARGPGTPAAGAGPPPPAPGPGADCSRRAVLGAYYSCKPAWSGNNGGATYRGVGAHQVEVVDYIPSLGPQFASIGSVAASVPAWLEDREVAIFAAYLNANTQTYGRRVVVSVMRSDQPLGDAAGARSDAVAVDQRYHAFLDVGAFDPNFLDEAARRGIESIVGAQMPQSFLAAHAPLVWGLLPSTDTTTSMVAEYVAKRLGVASPARFGGEQSRPPVDGQPRRFGIVYPTTNPDGGPSILAGAGPQLARRLQRAGARVVADVGYRAISGDADAATEALNVVAQLRAARATTVACLCDPIEPIYLTRAASSQGWYPEWLQTGFEDTDADQVGRLYDPSQWRHSFGISPLPTPLPPDQTPAWRVFRAADRTDPLPLDAQAVFGELQVAFAAIEAAGPRLDPYSFARAMFGLYLPTDPLFYYSRSDLGGIKDAREVWWDPQAVGADGGRGAYLQVDGGHRYALGHWPPTPTRVFDRACLAPGSCGAPPSSARRLT